MGDPDPRAGRRVAAGPDEQAVRARDRRARARPRHLSAPPNGRAPIALLLVDDLDPKTRARAAVRAHDPRRAHDRGPPGGGPGAHAARSRQAWRVAGLREIPLRIVRGSRRRVGAPGAGSSPPTTARRSRRDRPRSGRRTPRTRTSGSPIDAPARGSTARSSRTRTCASPSCATIPTACIPFSATSRAVRRCASRRAASTRW